MRKPKPSPNDLINELLRVSRELAELTEVSAQDAGIELQLPHQQSLDIIEFLPDATFVIDGKSRVIAWNRAMEEMTGLEKREILGKGDYLYAIPFYGEPRPILIDLVVGNEGDSQDAYNFVERHGRDLYAETYAPRLYGGKGAHLWGKASPLFDTSGKLTGAIESIRDITQRKIAEEALRKSEQRFRMLVETMNEGLGVSDENGVIVYANDQLCEMLGYAKDEILGRREIDFLERANGVTLENEEMGRRLNEKTSCETEMLSKDGRRIPVIISVSPITDERGHYKGTIGTVRDITIRKQAEKKLRESEEKHRMIFENSPLGIIHFDQNGTITACNDTIIKIWGSARENLIGFNLMNSLKNKKMKAAVGACLAGKHGCYEGQYLSITGGKITNLKADFGPILADDGSCLGGIGILEDLSEWRCSEEAVEEPHKQ
jgi:PAS domain S-box-containing protein